MLKSVGQYTRCREIRLRKQTTVRIEIVEPRGSHHPDRLSLGAFDVREECREIRQPPTAALDPERRGPVRFGVLEVKTKAIVAQPRV